MKKLAIAILAAVLGTVAAWAFDEIPVYGGSKVGYEDRDLLDGTILEEGVLVVTPEEPWRVFIGDGVTPGGLEVHPKGYVTHFAEVSSADTNLNMHSYSIEFGPWKMRGDGNEFDIDYEGREHWLRFVRDTGEAYLRYDFDIIDASHYRFSLAWAGEGYDFPRLQVSTNMAQGYVDADIEHVTYERPDQAHLVILYEVTYDYDALAFRLFETARLASGAYFGVPVMAEHGEQVTGGLVVTGRMESVWSEEGEEFRDEYTPGTFTLNGVTWDELPDVDGFATTDSVNAAVARIGTLETNAGTHATRDWTVGYVATNHQSLAGYATEEWVGEQGYLTEHQSLADYALTSWTIGYVATNHQSLAGYATESWVGEQGFLTSHQSLAGLASESWVSDYVATNHQSLAGLASESWVEGYVATNHQSLAGLASETWVEGYVSTNHQSLSGYATEAWTEAYISTNHQDLSGYATTSAVASVSDRVGAIEADYVQAADIAEFATTGTVASVERRVGALEYPDWCTLYWGTNVMWGNNLTFPIPTNFPTKNLRIYIIDTYASAVDLVVQTNWAPQGDCMIEILATAASAQTNRDIRLKIGGTQIEKLTSQTTRRKWVLCFDSTFGYWHVRQGVHGFYNYIYPTSGYQAWTFPATAPKTVEEWLARHPELGASP